MSLHPDNTSVILICVFVCFFFIYPTPPLGSCFISEALGAYECWLLLFFFVTCIACLSHLVICLHPFATSCFLLLSVSCFLFSYLSSVFLWTNSFPRCHMCRVILNDGASPSLTVRTYALPSPIFYSPLPVLPPLSHSPQKSVHLDKMLLKGRLLSLSMASHY